MATRNDSKAKNEIIEMLQEDHRRARRAFREAERLDEQDDQLEQLVLQTCAELEVHATLEEELLYPALRDAIKQPELIDEAEVEHASAKELIAQLQAMQVDEPRFKATFKVLGEYIKHHIREEENEIFEQLNRTGIAWESMLQQMQERRAELMVESGLEVEDAEQAETDKESEEVKRPNRSAQAGSGGRGRVRRETAVAAHEGGSE